MPETNGDSEKDLKEDKKDSSIEGVVVSSEVSSADNQNENAFEDDYKESVWDILEQAGLTKGRIIGFLVFFVLVVVIVFFFFFRDSGGDEKIDDIGKGVVEDNRGNGNVLETPHIIGNEGNTDIKGIPIGEFASGGTIAVDLAFSLGRGFATEEMVQFARYLNLIEILQNVYNTDIYAYLDASKNRIEALDAYVAELEFLIEESKLARDDVNAILANLREQYTGLVAEQNVQEKSFFQAVDSLNGVEADGRLEAFIILGQEIVEVRAIHNAYLELSKMFDNVLFYLEPRLRDIELNRAPLLDGNRVIIIDNSDLGTVIYR